MNATIASSMRALREADPALESDVGAICPDWDSVLAQLTTESVAVVDSDTAPAPQPAAVRVPVRRGTRRGTRRIRLAVAAAVVAAAAIVAGVVVWPWSGGHPTSVAYGVTKQPDGTVVVRPAPGRPFTASDLQARLRAAGVPVVVLVESAAGACTEPLPTTIPSSGSVITHPSNLPRDVAFVVDPAALPSGAVLVVALPPVGLDGTGSRTAPAFADLFVTRQPPTCVAARPSTSPSTPVTTATS